jgi:dTDP-4-amino-4,6-dideoxygalactose transaminase
LLTAGRGGAVLTRHANVHQRARLQLHRGNAVCPLSELQAAVLLPQLDALPARHARRLRGARLLAERLGDVHGLRPFRNRADGEPAYYKFGLQLDPARFGLARERLVAAARAEGVALDEGFRALHAGRSPSRLRRAGPLDEAERAGVNAVVLHHPVLLGSDEDVEQVAVALTKIRAHAARLA